MQRRQAQTIEIRLLDKAIAESVLTGDGKPFKLGYCEHYYLIAGQYSNHSIPSVIPVTVSTLHFELSDYNFARIKVRHMESDNGSWVSIDDLYFDKDAADKALVKILKKKREWIDAEIEKKMKGYQDEDED